MKIRTKGDGPILLETARHAICAEHNEIKKVRRPSVALNTATGNLTTAGCHSGANSALACGLAVASKKSLWLGNPSDVVSHRIKCVRVNGVN